jgi:hypothetical protein
MCSLEEAFSSFTDTSRNEDQGPANGSPSLFALDTDKKRRKKRRAALPPPEPMVIEPDRPAHRPLPPGELLGGSPTSNSKSTSESEMLNAFETADYFPHPAEDVMDKNVYKLEPDWATAFNDTSIPDWIKNRMPHRENEAPLIPSPWLDGQPTLWQKIGKDEARQADLKGAEVAANERLDSLQRKLDSMFNKLEQMEVTKSESNLLEILLFVLGGIFLILILDILVKQGTQATMMIAAAGGGGLYKRYMPFRQLSR